VLDDRRSMRARAPAHSSSLQPTPGARSTLLPARLTNDHRTDGRVLRLGCAFFAAGSGRHSGKSPWSRACFRCVAFDCRCSAALSMCVAVAKQSWPAARRMIGGWRRLSCTAPERSALEGDHVFLLLTSHGVSQTRALESEQIAPTPLATMEGVRRLSCVAHPRDHRRSRWVKVCEAFPAPCPSRCSTGFVNRLCVASTRSPLLATEASNRRRVRPDTTLSRSTM
jgi:hypothetical protein